MSALVVTAGEILVEIMADTPGEGFSAPIALTGPYPSGAPAIFVDQMARLGTPAAIVGCVGDDDFGRLNLERLSRDGVDVSAVAVHPERPTGTAFVRYRPDGSRDFVFNIAHSAAGALALTDAARAVIARATHVHVMGTALVAGPTRDIVRHALAHVRATAGTVSFDPNIRKEMLDLPGLADALNEVLAAADLFLPSGPEIALFSAEAGETGAARDILGRGVRAVVVKHGRDGARYIDRDTDISVPAFAVEEVDPTGAGDCFAASFVAAWLAGLPPRACLLRANAAGALAVTRRGPMEGASHAAAIDAVIARASGT